MICYLCLYTKKIVMQLMESVSMSQSTRRLYDGRLWYSLRPDIKGNVEISLTFTNKT